MTGRQTVLIKCANDERGLLLSRFMKGTRRQRERRFGNIICAQGDNIGGSDLSPVVSLYPWLPCGIPHKVQKKNGCEIKKCN